MYIQQCKQSMLNVCTNTETNKQTNKPNKLKLN